MKALSRRDFLKLTGVGAMAVLAGCAENGEGEAPATSTDTGATTGAAAIGADASGNVMAAVDTVDESIEKATEMVDLLVLACGNATFDLSPFGGESGTRSWGYTLLWDKLACRPFKGANLDEMHMQIAKSVTKVDDYTYDVELYDYAKDSEGNAITADDVIWSFEYSQSIGRYAALSSYMASITKTGDYSVRIVLSILVAGAIEQILTAVTICSQKWFEGASEEAKTANPATTGAYTITELTSGAGFTFDYNPDYWQNDVSLRSYLDQQNVATLVYKVITEAAMRAVAIENGEVDVAQLDNTNLAHFINDDGTAIDGYNVFLYSNSMFNWIEYNCDEGKPFNNKYLRQAASYAMDSLQLQLASGNPAYMGKLLYDFCGSEGGDYNTAWDSEDYYGYDVEKAKECFEKSGYKAGEVTIDLMISSGTANAAVAATIQAFLKVIGINVEIHEYELALYNDYCLQSEQWDMITRSGSLADYTVSGWAKVFDENVFPTSGTHNFVHDDKLQELLYAASVDHTPEAIDAFHYYLKEECYAIGTYATYKNLVTNPGVLSYGTLYEGNPVWNNANFASDYVSVGL